MKKLFLATILLLFFLPFSVLAQDKLGESRIFYVEKTYDLLSRTSLEATLIKISPQVYFYVESDWWEGLKEEEANEARDSLNKLAEEFENRIYPTLTQVFGKEWSPGIDNDTRITILIHRMVRESGGYFKNGDEYPKSQFPESNEREMLYLNSQHINNFALSKSFLAHEFMHLINFNQKEKRWGVVDDVWLQEARSEYAPTLLGYDKEYQGSNLQRRVKNFLDRPYDSLTEWRGDPADYGVVNLFAQYLVDHYGISILRDSLLSSRTGIDSINEVLAERKFSEDFSDIFFNWAIAVLINDCAIDQNYCYKNEQLKNFKVTPLINYLPFVGESTLSVNNTTRDWAGNWHKFIGGQGELKIEFRGQEKVKFKVPYIIENSDGGYSVGSLDLDERNSASITVSNFGGENLSFTLIPIAMEKTSDFSEIEPARSFFWSASTVEKGFQEKPILEKPIFEMTKEEILAKIAEVKRLILNLRSQLAELTGASNVSCRKLDVNLYYGLMQNDDVKCLQEFLKAQGSDIYPEGLVTGNFLTLTKSAVIRFQEKYASEILAPLGLTRGTGYVGPSTRAKINELLGQ